MLTLTMCVYLCTFVNTYRRRRGHLFEYTLTNRGLTPVGSCPRFSLTLNLSSLTSNYPQWVKKIFTYFFCVNGKMCMLHRQFTRYIYGFVNTYIGGHLFEYTLTPGWLMSPVFAELEWSPQLGTHTRGVYLQVVKKPSVYRKVHFRLYRIYT